MNIPAVSRKPITNIIGRRFARLTVTAYAEKRGRLHYWHVSCDCGGVAVVAGSAMTSGNTKSCGCAKRDSAGQNLTTHGLTKTRAHGIWKAAKQRCFNPNASNYRHYGGRGITMCDRWRDSFQAFYDDMGECPPGLSLERISHEGNYEPENCRWASQAEQVRNTRRNVLVEHEGRVMVAKDFAGETGAVYSTLLAKLRQAARTSAPSSL